MTAPSPDREAAAQAVADRIRKHIEFVGTCGWTVANASNLAVDALVAAGWRSPDEVAAAIAAARQEGREQAAQAISEWAARFTDMNIRSLFMLAADVARGGQQ